MGQVLHGSATTTEAIRRAIQHSQESLRALAKRYGINPKTVAKWKKRTSVADLPTGPKEPRSTVLTIEEEAVIVAFRKAYAVAARRLPLRAAADDPAPDPLVPASLPAAPWHRPAAGGRGRQARQAQVQDLSDRLLPHRHRRGPDRAKASSTCSSPSTGPPSSPSSSCTRRPTGGSPPTSSRPRRGRSLQGPHRPDRQRHPVHRPGRRARHAEIKDAIAPGALPRHMPSNAPAREHDIEHRLTKPKHPWTNGQVERMNRTIKEATVKRFHYDTPRAAAQPISPTSSPPTTSRRRLKTLKGLTPYEFICKRLDTRSPNDSPSIRSIKCRD